LYRATNSGKSAKKGRLQVAAYIEMTQVHMHAQLSLLHVHVHVPMSGPVWCLQAALRQPYMWTVVADLLLGRGGPGLVT
jgi:hypothetical protein